MSGDEKKSAVFAENEIKANHYTSVACLITAILFCATLALNLLGVFDADNGMFIILTAVVVPELLVPYILNRVYGGKKRWLKHLLIAATVAGVICADIVLTYSVALLAVLPIILSCHYYSKKMTVVTAVSMAICLGVSTVLGTYFGILDLNNVSLAQGTVLTVVTDFEDAVLSSPVNYEETVINAMQYIYLPKLLVICALTPICYAISTRTRSLIADNDAAVRKDERINTELNVASNIQSAMLPKILPTFPNRPEFDLYASMNAAKEVGGDFYDCFFTDDNHFAVVMADVSGKGIPASMFMVVAKTLLKNKLQSGEPIDMAFNELNRQICDGNEMNMFVTMWAAVIDLKNGHADYINAGHNPPLLKRADGEFEYFKNVSGLIVGVMDDSTYTKHELTLNKGDALFLYTDGVTEAMNESDEQYGEARLKAFLDSNADKPVEELTQAVKTDLEAYAGLAEQSDDITLLTLKWNKQTD